MRAINKKAQAVMDRIFSGLDSENSHTRIDNNAPDSGIMPAVVEWVGDCKLGDIFSVAHYYEQNGDLMADPEMTFLRGEDRRYYPLSYKLDSLGVYRDGRMASRGTSTRGSSATRRSSRERGWQT